MAGVVEELGRGVTRFAPGDRVFGMPRFPREAAAYAEYVTAPSRQLARIPEGLGDVEAAALPLAGLTAWQALVETAGVGPKSRVLILAAAGGVGHLAVQIAKARGAYVIGTARPEKHAFLASLGADEAVDYTTEATRSATSTTSTSSSTSSAARRRLDALSTLRDGGTFVTVTGRRTRCASRRPAGSESQASSSSPTASGWSRLQSSSPRASSRPHVVGDVPPRRRGARARSGRDGPHAGQARADRRLSDLNAAGSKLP